MSPRRTIPRGWTRALQSWLDRSAAPPAPPVSAPTTPTKHPGPGLRQLLRKDIRAMTSQQFMQGLLLTSQGSGVATASGRSPRVVVSLTSIPQRLYDVSTTIESLLHQTVQPDVIVLWLDESKCNDATLPLDLQRQKARGLTVRYCPDIGPHTKLIPALKAYPNDVVITVDDDVIYPFHLLERLTRAHDEDPSKIYCTRARRIVRGPPEKFTYSRDWPNLLRESEGLRVMPLGVGGVLYPPGIFGDEEVFHLETQRKLAPKADDIWFKAMSLRQGVICKRLHFHKAPFPTTPSSQEVELGAYNVTKNGNDKQIRATFDHYDLWPALLAAPLP